MIEKERLPHDPAIVRDREKIKELREKYNLKNVDSLKKLYKELQNGSIRFESSEGQKFDDEVYECFQKIKETESSREYYSRNSQKYASSESVTSKAKKKVKQLEEYDEDMQAQIRREMRRTERKRKILILVFAITSVFCIGYFVLYYYRAQKSENRWNDLAQLIGSDALASHNNDSRNEISGNPNSSITINLSDEEIVVPDVLSKYETLYNSNRNLIGWLKIDDTIIDYPVMQCGDNSYYLNHNFDQQEDRTGTLFLDYRCDVISGSTNYIIYGHHMTSGKMFSRLPDYESERYYEEHPYIQFDTIYEEATYQVMYAFRTRIYNEDEVVFKYYQFINAYSEEEFNSYMEEMRSIAYYDTGVTAVYGDQLLTLTTCDYQETNGRFVVVAKRIS